MSRVLLLALLGLALAGPQQSVQNLSLDRNPLSRAKSLHCTFASLTAVSWDGSGGHPTTEAREMSLDVDSIDSQESTARIVASGSHITALLTANALHLLERSMQGNLTITTVFAREESKGKYRAVRSQHDYLPINIPGVVAEPTVSQAYGTCEMVE
jgi:hypothetical protein